MVKKMVTISGMYDFEEVVPISVYQKDGTELLLKLIQDQAQEGPHFFPNDTLTDQPEKVIVAEIIREKVLRNMRDEIPHGTAVVIERMRERPGKDIMDIDATILCEKSSHKGMIIGKQGSMLKKIASRVRRSKAFWKPESISSAGSRSAKTGETVSFPSAIWDLINDSSIWQC